MSYENEIKHLKRELKFAKSDYLNARLKSEDALRIHAFKTDVETIEFQIDVFEKAAKADEYEAKAKAYNDTLKTLDKLINDDERYKESRSNDFVAGMLIAYEKIFNLMEDYIKESGESDA